MPGYIPRHIVDAAKQFGDKIHRTHGGLLLLLASQLAALGNPVFMSN